MSVYVAFRRTAAVGAPWWQRALCALVRWRLVSQWCHAGVICDGVLHHVTATDGLTSTDDWTLGRWELFALPDAYHRAALSQLGVLRMRKYEVLAAPDAATAQAIADGILGAVAQIGAAL